MQAFESLGTGAGTITPGDRSVPSICNILEDSGFTVKRCSDVDEAIARSRTLQLEQQLRCVIVGGDQEGLTEMPMQAGELDRARGCESDNVVVRGGVDGIFLLPLFSGCNNKSTSSSKAWQLLLGCCARKTSFQTLPT